MLCCLFLSHVYIEWDEMKLCDFFFDSKIHFLTITNDKSDDIMGGNAMVRRKTKMIMKFFIIMNCCVAFLVIIIISCCCCIIIEVVIMIEIFFSIKSDRFSF